MPSARAHSNMKSQIPLILLCLYAEKNLKHPCLPQIHYLDEAELYFDYSFC